MQRIATLGQLDWYDGSAALNAILAKLPKRRPSLYGLNDGKGSG